jgi:hypothetical protein
LVKFGLWLVSDIRGIKRNGGDILRTSDPTALLRRLLQERSETEWLEFKHNNCDLGEIGQCISACANSAMLAEKDRAFIVFGIEDKTPRLIPLSQVDQYLGLAGQIQNVAGFAFFGS